MNTNEIEVGEIYYSTHQKKPVEVLALHSDYATVQDQAGNVSRVHVSTLQKWDLSADEILEREA